MNSAVLQDPAPSAPPERPTRHAAVTATLWGVAGVLGGAAAGALAVLPFYPQGDPASLGWARLGWFVLLLLVAGSAALVAGAVCVWVGLRRAGNTRAGTTAAVFVPVALLLGALTAGVGALAAPAAAWWLVSGFGRRGQHGRGPHRGWQATGLAQRLVITLVVCAIVTGYVLDKAGYSLGGRPWGELLAFAVCLPGLVGVPVLLLRRLVPTVALVAGIAAMGTVTALAVPSSVAGAHPDPQRLAELASDVQVPDGFEVTDTLVTTVIRDTLSRALPDEVLPVTVVAIAPVGAASGPGVPAALLPTADGTLSGPDEPGWPGDGQSWIQPQALPASTQGQGAASAWHGLLVQDGWEVDEFSPPDGDSYWLPTPARAVADAGLPRLERGPWVRASVVPYGDGAVLVVSARP